MNISLSEPAPAVTNTSVGGHLRLECSARPDGGTYISRQDFRAPVHIGKGHTDAGALVLNLANPTAGFFDGDHVEIDVAVSEGARLCLGTPAAARVYPSRSGKPATVRQRFAVAAGGSLEWMPEPFIPHAGACYRQMTEIHLEPGASLLFLEWIAPGRVAMGETFAYRSLRWELDLFHQGSLAARERYDLRPGGHSLEALRIRFPAAHYISVFAAGEFARAWPDGELDGLESADANIGHGGLEGGVRVIRALCRDSIAARALARSIRHTLYQNTGRLPPSLGHPV